MQWAKHVYCVAVGCLHAGKPHVMSVFEILFSYFATGINVVYTQKEMDCELASLNFSVINVSKSLQVN
jgi:hypothetical protein